MGVAVSFKELNLKLSYRSDTRKEIVDEFYIPVLSNSITYKRAVGFFSSSSLINISEGISKLIYNGGKIKLIVSPKMTEEDIEAIDRGYKSRKEVIEDNISRNFIEPKTKNEKERYNYLAHLIANNQLDIKIAAPRSNKVMAMYHEKIGICEDALGNIVAFTGSLNESENSFVYNFESIDVFCSWKGENDRERIELKNRNFDDMWKDNTDNLVVFDFPQALKKKILEYKKNDILDEASLVWEENKKEYIPEDKNLPRNPEWLKLREYQHEAINAWKENDFVGLLNMATGTGKTLTALAAVSELVKCKYDDNILIIIVCPYTHLIEQWKEDIKEFNINPIVAYSHPKYKNWKRDLTAVIRRLNLGVINSACVITTNATYKSEKFQEELEYAGENVLLLIDEAHNAGAEQFSKFLLKKFRYRLALSATPERHNDENGTSSILRYFRKEVFTFTLERAISEGYLTKYFYYPQIIYLTEEEREKYLKISKQIAKFMDSNGKLKSGKTVEMLLIKRARIIAGAENKITKLKELIKDKTDSNYNLIYCGATETKENESDNLSRQITAVTKLLGNEFNMKIAKFTSEESMEERKDIINKFSNGIDLQAIVAIKCLDEGVNIPAIRNAFILASTTNPREFIQRRGRVLRKYEGKEFAYIYDFITLPRSENEIYSATSKELKSDLSLIKKELIRVREFANLAENKHRAVKNIEEILSYYDGLILD